MAKFVRPYGQNNTGAGSKKSNIIPRTSVNGAEVEPVAFETFNSSYPLILIAQWISVIDKIINKPNQDDVDTDNANITKRKNDPFSNDLKRKLQIETRLKIGAACWKLLKEKLPKDKLAEYESRWQWKLNPAGSDFTKFNNGKHKELKIVGHWYYTYLGKLDIADIDADVLADDIEAHLDSDERRKNGGFRAFHKKLADGSYEKINKGLIKSRAGSIANNTLKMRMEDKLTNEKLAAMAQTTAQLAWSDDDKKKFSTKPELASTIYNKNKELEDNNRRIGSREAAAMIFAHYGTQFGSGGMVPKRREIEENGQKGLLNLYDAVRGYYKNFLENTAKGRGTNSKLSNILPKDDAALFCLLKKRHDNSLTNDLVRLGRVIHYESSPDDSNGVSL
ncbi:MAG: hypothetical protein GY761_05635, partial [Hyphomicrobiales bacterium]|nr:hypothetical protein [Hyphomicrobiales bacterium]